jgi:hypothetical protein
VDAIQPLPFPAMQSLLNASFPDGTHNYWKSTMQRELSNEAIDDIVAMGERMNSPLSAIVVEYYGGAAGRVARDATAFPHRDSPWDIIIAAQWTDPADTSHREWARSCTETLRPYSAGGHLISALDVETDEVIRSAFGTNLPMLAEVKRKYDPDNFFRVNQNVRPALAQGEAAGQG